MKRHLRWLALLVVVSAAPARADRLDDAIQAEMDKSHVPGLSLAVIQDGKIVRAKGYGSTERNGGHPVTPETLFQAGSVSKPVAAVGALRLVQEGRLSLDGDVNAWLTSWKVPANEFTRQKKVTLRGLLSHTAGFTVHGFPGYDAAGPVPTLIQVLNGEKPANTAPIRVDFVPGSQWRYSGGGYTVMQQLLIDVTRKPFPEYMRAAVLQPFGMSRSSFEQPLPADLAAATATGYYANGKPVPGRWHVYPEMAAAGLWTTASDLARFAIGIQQAMAGTANPVLTQAMARQMLTTQMDHYGLGVSLNGNGPTLLFGHAGRDEGFDTGMTAYAEKGLGAVIMMNANEDSGAAERLFTRIAAEYRWPDYPTAPPG